MAQKKPRTAATNVKTRAVDIHVGDERHIDDAPPTPIEIAACAITNGMSAEAIALKIHAYRIAQGG